MKYSNLTYYLLAILCIMITSCSTDGVTDDFSDSKSQILVKDVHINFVLSFPANSSTRVSEDNGLESERAINNVHVYTFQNNRFIEEIQYIVIDGKDGDIRRNIDGKLSGTYNTGTPMDFIVIVNAKNKGVYDVKMNPENSKTDLYDQLIFSYAKDTDRSTYIPMWGEGTITSVTSGENNTGELTLKRAVAKVNVTVNGGNGITDFKITEVRLHQYNTQGYYAPLKDDGPSVPESSKISTEFLTSGILSGVEGNKVENKFYIPEHKNIGAEKEAKVYLVIEAEARGKMKSYTIPFSENGKDYNVLRNHIYVFNITSVNMDVTLDYEVKVWETENIDVPSFD